MPPNLSFERLAIVLALAGCSKATPAADTSSTVRSDPSASALAQPEAQGATPPPPAITASAAATIAAPGSPAPRGGASAIELHKKKDMSPTGQASCGAGNCTSEIKKK
jgi:hypothetical protein